MKRERYSRYSGIIDPSVLNKTRVAVIGLGSIGSQVSLALARSGFGNIQIQDFDTVDPENFGVQNYDPADVGKPKVVAMYEKIVDVNPEVRIQIHKHRAFGNEPYLENVDIIVLALDSISAREEIFHNIMDRHLRVFLVDGRMGAETARVISVNLPEEAEIYENTLFPENQAEQVPCTEKSTLWNSLIIGGLVAGSIIRNLRQDSFPPDYLFSIRDYSLTVLQTKKEGSNGNQRISLSVVDMEEGGTV